MSALAVSSSLAPEGLTGAVAHAAGLLGRPTGDLLLLLAGDAVLHGSDRLLGLLGGSQAFHLLPRWI